MKKISNEVRIGAIAVVTIILFIWLFNFLKGREFLKSTVNYYAIYDKIGGLAESSPVEINGYKVGVVQSIKFLDPVSGRLLVVLSVNRDFRLPVNTVAEITPLSVIAGMKVQFVYGNGPGFYSYGDTIPGRVATSVITRLEEEFVPLKDKIAGLIVALDSVIVSVNTEDIGATISNLRSTTGSIDNIIGSQEEELKATLANISIFSKMLSDNSARMSSTFNNLGSISDTLASADIHGSVVSLKSSLEKTSLLLENLNDGKGSAGQLLTDDSMYANLNKSLVSLNILLEDLRANPKKYVHFSIFGRKNSDSE
jgi:phospholipid/cholesterol/gamma-HCH transport system substrate-binding protein